jgi:DNA polymerase III alpha subunit
MAGRWSRVETWQRERAALGFGLSRHPIELHDFGGLEQRCLPLDELVHHAGERVELLGWKYAHKTIRTRTRQERMAFLSLEDARGTCEAVLFPAAWERHALLCRESGPFWLRGTVDLEAGVPMLQVEEMARAGRLSERRARGLD